LTVEKGDLHSNYRLLQDGSVDNYTGVSINSENVHRTYSMDIQSQIMNYTRFSKSKVGLKRFLENRSETVSTEYGYCLEMNDHEGLVQVSNSREGTIYSTALNTLLT